MNRFIIDKETKEIYFVEKYLGTGYVRLVNPKQVSFPTGENSFPLYYDPCPNNLILTCIFTWDKKYWGKNIFKELT